MRPSYNVKFIMWGFFLGIFLAISIETGLFEIWHSLGKPPEEIVRIVGANSESVYIQSKSGLFYKYYFFEGGDGSKNKIWEIENNRDLRLYTKKTDSSYFIIVPPLFWENQSLLINDYATVENGGFRKFLVAPDNSVWMWRHFSTGMGIIFLPVFPMAGIVLGAFVALIWFIVQLISNHFRRS